jgi:arsenate reductase
MARQPVTAHWGVPDPAAVKGTEEEIHTAYRDAFFMLERRISLFLCLPLASINGLALKTKLDEIGRQ